MRQGAESRWIAEILLAQALKPMQFDRKYTPDSRSGPQRDAARDDRDRCLRRAAPRRPARSSARGDAVSARPAPRLRHDHVAQRGLPAAGESGKHPHPNSLTRGFTGRRAGITVLEQLLVDLLRPARPLEAPTIATMAPNIAAGLERHGILFAQRDDSFRACAARTCDLLHQRGCRWMPVGPVWDTPSSSTNFMPGLAWRRSCISLSV